MPAGGEKLGAAAGGRERLRAAFRLCDPLGSEDDVEALAYWAQVGRAGARPCFLRRLWG